MNHFREYQNLQMIIRTFEGIMRSLSEYHFRDMHQVILSTEKEANTTSQTARAVCMQNNGMLCVCFSFENQICQGSSF